MSVPAISKPILRFFRYVVRGYFRRSFHGVRVSCGDRFVHDGRPLIVYANHGSWWDPMVAILLADMLMPQRKHFAPMDEEPLSRYGILRKVGIFPVEMKTGRGAVQFLRKGEAILRGGGVLWVTPQGRFADARERPLDFKPGLSALAARIGEGCTVLPLALEYAFWDERLPECLIRFGDPVVVGSGEQAPELEPRLVGALEGEMEALKKLVLARDARAFRTLLEGGKGPGGFYAFGQWAKRVLSTRGSGKRSKA